MIDIRSLVSLSAPPKISYNLTDELYSRKWHAYVSEVNAEI